LCKLRGSCGRISVRVDHDTINEIEAYNCSRAGSSTKGSLMMPNMGTTFLYCGWEMNCEHLISLQCRRTAAMSYLNNDPHVVERALSVRVTHRSLHPVLLTEAPRVIPTVLRAGDGVQVEVDAQTILAGPFECLEDVRPRDLGQERLAIPDLNAPVRDTMGAGEYWLRNFKARQSRTADGSNSDQRRRCLRNLARSTIVMAKRCVSKVP